MNAEASPTNRSGERFKAVFVTPPTPPGFPSLSGNVVCFCLSASWSAWKAVMGDGNTVPKKARLSPEDRAAAAALSKELAAARERRAQAEIEYNLDTENLFFTKDFNTALEAIMRDVLASPAQRILAYAKPGLVGRVAKWAIGVDQAHPRSSRSAAKRPRAQRSGSSRRRWPIFRREATWKITRSCCILSLPLSSPHRAPSPKSRWR